MESAGTRFRMWYQAQPRAIRALLTINVLVYLLWQIVFIHFGPTQRFVLQYLALNPDLPGVLFQPWQLVTYSFLHLQPGFGGLLHVLFNMLWMVWIGRDYEEMYGPARLLAIYIYGAVGGALLTVILHAAFPGVGVFGGTVHGASAAVLAIMTTVAIEHPQKSIALLFIGVVRLIHVVIGFLVLDLLFLAAGGTSVSAHLGGVATGFLFAKASERGFVATGWASIFFGGSGGRGRKDDRSVLEKLEAWLGGGDSSGRSESRRTARVHKMPGRSDGDERDEIGAESDVDRILDKISESGYESLTDEEKRILYEAGDSK